MRRTIPTLLVAALIAIGCSGDVTGLGLGERRAILRALEQNEEKWQALGLENYVYRFRRVCECPVTATVPVEIEVRNGSVFDVRLLSNGEHVAPGSGFWPTVAELFGEIRLALADDATDIRVRYDPVFGYPLEVSISWRPEAVDGIGLFAGELVPIQ